MAGSLSFWGESTDGGPVKALAETRDFGHRHPCWVSRAKQRARGSRGAAILEAAFVTPVFFILVLGLVEIGLAMNDNLALASTVRAGSRVVSASGNETKADLYSLLRVAKESSALDKANIDRIVIYKPTGFGQDPSATCQAGTAVANVCNVYVLADLRAARIQVTEETLALAENRAPDPSKVKFGCGAMAPDRFWCPSARKVTQAGTGPDYVGVWMQIRHPWITKMFGTDRTLTDTSVIRLEPRQA